MNESTSRRLFEQACELIPGGVNSPVRACHNVHSLPLFIAEAHGCRLKDVDGQEYIDFVLSWGPMLLGHDHPEVTKAVRDAAGRGTSYGAPCPDEVTLAQMVVDAMPSLEMVRMVNSGTEATMSALRLARGVTGRDKVLKFIGCYHGHADPFLAAAGSGVATFAIPGTPGVPAAVVGDTLLAPYNDLDAVRELFAAHGKDIAAVIVEPVAANMGLVLPAAGFLEGLRELTSAATAFVTATAAFLESSAAALAVCLDFCSILRWAAVCAFLRARSITCLAVPAGFRAADFTAPVDVWADLSIAFRVLGANAPPGGFSFGPEERRGRSLMDGLID